MDPVPEYEPHRMSEPDRSSRIDSIGVPLVVRATAARRFGEFGVGVLMAAFCFMSVFPPSGEYFLPWLTIPISAFSSLHFLRRVVDGRPRLVVDEEGIVDRTSIVGGALRIPWEDVLSVSASRTANSVELHVRDLASLRNRAGFLRRLWMKLGAIAGQRPVSIVPTLLGFNKRELREHIDQRLLQAERVHLGLGERSPGELPGGSFRSSQRPI